MRPTQSSSSAQRLLLGTKFSNSRHPPWNRLSIASRRTITEIASTSTAISSPHNCVLYRMRYFTILYCMRPRLCHQFSQMTAVTQWIAPEKRCSLILAGGNPPVLLQFVKDGKCKNLYFCFLTFPLQFGYLDKFPINALRFGSIYQSSSRYFESL